MPKDSPSYLVPFDKPLLDTMHQIDKDYRDGKFKDIDKIVFSTDKALRLCQAMYETSVEVKDYHYRNLLIIFGVFSEICKERYETDVTFEDFFRVQKIVREFSERIRKLVGETLNKENSKKTKDYIK